MLMVGSDQFVSKNASLLQVIRQAYGVEDDRVANAPAWLATDKYDFVATAGSPIAGQNVEESGRIQRQMLQGVLADRLKLNAHFELRNVPAYALVIAKSGPKLKASTISDSNSDSSTVADGKTRRNGFHIDGAALIGNGVPIDALIFHLSRQLHRTIVNETGLSGTYEFTLRAPEGVPIGIDNAAPPESYEPALSSALTEQLGLTLEPRETKMEVLVIDHVEKPSTSEARLSADEVTIKRDPDATAKLRSNAEPIKVSVMWKDGNLDATGVTVHGLMMMAYQPIQHSQITGGPDWINFEVFDVHLKASATVTAAWPSMSKEQQDQAEQSMVRNLLAQNFGVKVHRESKIEPIYALVVDDASKLQAFDGDCPPKSSEPPQTDFNPLTMTPHCGGMIGMPGEMRANKVRVSDLLTGLSLGAGRIVVDRTNLTKRYVVNLKFAPDPTLGPPPPPGFAPLPVVGPGRPTLFDALVQQAGLRLVPQSGPVDVLVVEEATMPGQGTEAGR